MLPEALFRRKKTLGETVFLSEPDSRTDSQRELIDIVF